MQPINPHNQIKHGLTELSLAIRAYQQSLDNAVSEIEYLQKQNETLQYQIQCAYTLPNGDCLTLEELAQEYSRLLYERGQ